MATAEVKLDDYFLGDRQLHQDLHVAAEILLELISTAPRSLSTERLGRDPGAVTLEDAFRATFSSTCLLAASATRTPVAFVTLPLIA